MPAPNARLSFAAFSTRDVANLALQRSGALVDLPRVGKYSYLAWRQGRDWPLLVESAVRRRAILAYCNALIQADYVQFEHALPADGIGTVTDIGSGYGLVDVFLHRRYRCNLQLVDIEQSAERDHNFATRGAGYCALPVARRFLRGNGVPDDQIATCNPTIEALPETPSDLVVSLLSLAFHYPFETYRDYIASNLRPGGTLLIDVRRQARQDLSLLEDFQQRIVVKQTAKYDRLVLRGFRQPLQSRLRGNDGEDSAPANRRD